MSEKEGGRGDSQESQDGEVTSRQPTVSARPSPQQLSFTFLQQSHSFKNSPETNKSSESYFTSQREVRRKEKAMENSPSSSQTKSFPSFTSTQPTPSPSSPHHKRPPSPSTPHYQRLPREASSSPPPSKHPPRKRMEDRDAGSTGSKSKSHVPQHSDGEIINIKLNPQQGLLGYDFIHQCATKGQQTVPTDFNSGFHSKMDEEQHDTDPGDDMEEVDDREEEEEEEMDDEDENEGQNVLGGDPEWDMDELGGAPDRLGEKEPGPEQRPGPGPRSAPGEKRLGPNTQLREEMDTVIQKHGLSSGKTNRAPDSVNFGGDATMGKGDGVDMREHGNSKHYWTCIG